MRHWHQRRVRRPVVVLDCDNTLWKGVCGEIGAEGVQVSGVSEPAHDAQALPRWGHCVYAAKMKHPMYGTCLQNDGMLLKRQHIVAHRINWQRKSNNLIALAEEQFDRQFCIYR